MTGRQVIITWYRPEEKLPPEKGFYVVTFSGRYGSHTYDHVLGVAEYYKDGFGKDTWDVTGLEEYDSRTVHAWADLEPFEPRSGKKGE